MVLIGVLVLGSLLLFYAGVQQINTHSKTAKAYDALDTLAQKANELASLTSGTRDSVWIQIPSDDIVFRFSGKEILLISTRADGEQNMGSKELLTSISGKINTAQGLQQIFLTKINETDIFVGLPLPPENPQEQIPPEGSGGKTGGLE